MSRHSEFQQYLAQQQTRRRGRLRQVNEVGPCQQQRGVGPVAMHRLLAEVRAQLAQPR